MTPFALALALLSASPPAHAGYTWHPETYVSSSVAYGVFGTVRDSADSVQYIYCFTYLSGGVPAASCRAKDEDGLTLTCVSTDPDIVQIITNVDPYGYVYFKSVDGLCEYVLTGNGSMYLP